MTRAIFRILLLAISFCSTSVLYSSEPDFRTDGGSNDKLPWFKLKPGEFPPEGSAHYISGELIALDHVARTCVLRPDRNNSQRTDDYDIPMPFTLLSFGSLGFHGAPAELRHIPIGTHLHGQFYFEEKTGKDNKGAFTRALRLEDDFSFFVRQKRAWRTDAIQLDKGILTVTGVGPEAAQTDAKPTKFQIGASTRIWKGRAIGALGDLAAGQTVLIDLTVCTLKGPGRCTDIWIDPESREAATAQQLEVHRLFEREHGLPCWVDTVDNQKSIVTVTLFDGFDPAFKKDFQVNTDVAAAVAEDSLRTYDQINDNSMHGPILEVISIPAVPGSSGVQLKFKPSTLLEGYRPKRILRIFNGGWKIDDLPREERLYQ